MLREEYRRINLRVCDLLAIQQSPNTLKIKNMQLPKSEQPIQPPWGENVKVKSDLSWPLPTSPARPSVPPAWTASAVRRRNCVPASRRCCGPTMPLRCRSLDRPKPPGTMPQTQLPPSPLPEHPLQVGAKC